MIYGYVRVSTRRQRPDRQAENIKSKFPEAVLVTDAFSGTRSDRPGWRRLQKTVKPGDTIVFDEVSRMSRDAGEGFRVYAELFKRGVNLVFLKEPQINTETYKQALNAGIPLTGGNVDYILEGVNKFLLALAEEQIRLAFCQAEAEVKTLQQRTREGVAAARLRGRQIGQPKGAKLTTKKSIETKKLIRKHARVFGGTLTDQEIIKLAGVARGTFYKYKRDLMTAQEAESEAKTN